MSLPVDASAGVKIFKEHQLGKALQKTDVSYSVWFKWQSSVIWFFWGCLHKNLNNSCSLPEVGKAFDRLKEKLPQLSGRQSRPGSMRSPWPSTARGFQHENRATPSGEVLRSVRDKAASAWAARAWWKTLQCQRASVCHSAVQAEGSCDVLVFCFKQQYENTQIWNLRLKLWSFIIFILPKLLYGMWFLFELQRFTFTEGSYLMWFFLTLERKKWRCKQLLMKAFPFSQGKVNLSEYLAGPVI